MIAKIMGLTFGAIGAVALLVVLFFAIINFIFLSQAATAEGTVTTVQQSGRGFNALISFPTSDGRVIQFTSPINTRPPEFTVGQKVRVYYNPDDPAGSARPDSFISLWFWPFLAGIFAVVFGLIGLGFYSVYYLNQRKINWLRQNGQRVTGQVSQVRLNPSVRNRGKSPHQVWVQWRDPKNGQTHTFKSANIWLDPVPFSPGMEVSVLVDPKNTARYHVDIPSTLPSARR